MYFGKTHLYGTTILTWSKVFGTMNDEALPRSLGCPLRSGVFNFKTLFCCGGLDAVMNNVLPCMLAVVVSRVRRYYITQLTV